MSRRVVVTGIGLVSSLGIGNEANWTALLGGQSGIAPITRFDVSEFSTQIAGEVKAFDPLRFIEKKDVKKMDIFIQYAVAASQFAVDDSGLQITSANATRVGVFIASGIGGFTTWLSAPFHLLKTPRATSWTMSLPRAWASFSSAIAASSINPISVSPRMLRKIT